LCWRLAKRAESFDIMNHTHMTTPPSSSSALRTILLLLALVALIAAATILTDILSPRDRIVRSTGFSLFPPGPNDSLKAVLRTAGGQMRLPQLRPHPQQSDMTNSAR
jgi:hypothetical protein